MEWVKSKVGYYRHIAIATGSADLEVMFKRGDALAGELEQDGFIPDAMLHQLTRRPNQAKKLASELVRSGLWDRVKGGYLIVDFGAINSELVRLSERKRRDRERKRAERAASVDESTDRSVDSPPDSPAPRPKDSLLDHQRKSQTKTAAAAAGDAAAAAPSTLDPVIAVLADKLRAHTPLRGLRFDTLNHDQVARLRALVELHSDEPLVAVAISTCRTPAPTHASAFLGTWESLPPPGRPLHVVRPRYCDTHNTKLTPAGVCSSCASDQKAGNR